MLRTRLIRAHQLAGSSIVGVRSVSLLALRAHHARVVIGDIHQAGRHLGQLERLDHPGRHPP
jgi:hypothetical protein